MFNSPKRLRLTFEPNFQTQSDVNYIEVVEVPIDEEAEEMSSISSCSFTFSYPSTSSSPTSSPVIPGTPEEEEEEGEKEEGKEEAEEKVEKEEEEMEEMEEEEKEDEEKKEEEIEKEEKEEGEEEEEEWPAAETSGPPKSPQRSYFSSCSSSTSGSASVGGPSSQGNEDTSFSQISIYTEPLRRDPLEEKVTDLVHFMILKYRMRKLITKAEMLNVIKRYKSQFPVIFKKACKCLEVISGIDVKEVDPTTHSYILFNSLDLTYDEMLSDDWSMPKNGLLMIILGVIFTEGNCAPEKGMWDFLNIMGVYDGRKHFICGELRKLITRDWVQENYLEYRQVPNSDPPCYEFLWGPRAHAETSKLKVLEFLVKIKATDPISFSCWYEEALRD